MRKRFSISGAALLAAAAAMGVPVFAQPEAPVVGPSASGPSATPPGSGRTRRNTAAGRAAPGDATADHLAPNCAAAPRLTGAAESVNKQYRSLRCRHRQCELARPARYGCRDTYDHSGGKQSAGRRLQRLVQGYMEPAERLRDRP
jgi:hypothetical protein